MLQNFTKVAAPCSLERKREIVFLVKHTRDVVRCRHRGRAQRWFVTAARHRCSLLPVVAAARRRREAR